MNKLVTILDYGAGNLLSVQRIFETCGASVLLTSDPKKIYLAERLVVPGVGAFGNCMDSIRSNNFIEPIMKHIGSELPLLGICVGMQMLFDFSEEFGKHDGLGILKGKITKIPKNEDSNHSYKVPHIGWEELIENNTWENTILSGVSSLDSVYFLHSFSAYPEDDKDLLASYRLGKHTITAAVQKNNIMGTQFHPEKSGEVGMKIIKNFLSY